MNMADKMMTGNWVTFTLLHSDNPGDDAITLLRRSICGIQISSEGGAFLHLPSGVLEVVETPEQVLEILEVHEALGRPAPP